MLEGAKSHFGEGSSRNTATTRVAREHRAAHLHRSLSEAPRSCSSLIPAQTRLLFPRGCSPSVTSCIPVYELDSRPHSRRHAQTTDSRDESSPRRPAGFAKSPLGTPCKLSTSPLDKADFGVCHLYLTDRRAAGMEHLPGQDTGGKQWLSERVTEDFHVNDPHANTYPPPSCASSKPSRALASVTLTLLLFDRYDEPRCSLPQSPRAHRPRLERAALAYRPVGAPPGAIAAASPREQGRTMTRALSRLAPLLTLLRISRVVASLMAWGDGVRGLERMLQQDDLASTGFPSTLKYLRPDAAAAPPRPERTGRAAGAFPPLSGPAFAVKDASHLAGHAGLIPGASPMVY